MEATDNYHSTSSYNPRTRASIEALFTGMPLITPGLVRSRSGRTSVFPPTRSSSACTRASPERKPAAVQLGGRQDGVPGKGRLEEIGEEGRARAVGVETEIVGGRRVKDDDAAHPASAASRRGAR